MYYYNKQTNTKTAHTHTHHCMTQFRIPNTKRTKLHWRQRSETAGELRVGEGRRSIRSFRLTDHISTRIGSKCCRIIPLIVSLFAHRAEAERTRAPRGPARRGVPSAPRSLRLVSFLFFKSTSRIHFSVVSSHTLYLDFREFKQRTLHLCSCAAPGNKRAC